MESLFRHEASCVCPLLWHHSFLQLRAASAAVTLPPGDHDDSNDDDDNDDNDDLTPDLLQPEPGRGQCALRPRPDGDLPAGGAEGGLGPAAHPPAAGQRGRGGHRPGQGNPLLDTQPPATTLQGDMIICDILQW